ncbi:MAG: hypothetical protein F6K55_49080 [Moorea sp. SIO4A3]|nr:hypothetical protein [Moorena sp. SIO4A3]
MEAIESLSIDDQLGLLWVLYDNMGGLVTPAAPGATEGIKLAGGSEAFFKLFTQRARSAYAYCRFSI